jgi:GNAT superfamily N-acetyltransferase
LHAADVTIRELAPHETHLAYEAMRELRPQLASVEQFVEVVNRLQRPEGYRLVAVFDEAHDQAATVAGFRAGHQLARGFHLYVDDLSTRERFRGRGYGGALMDWLETEARRLGCVQIELDSGVGQDRQTAHRLYMNKRMRISSFHFTRRLE